MDDSATCRKDYDRGVKLGWLSAAIESEGSISLTWARRKDGTFQIIPRVTLCNLDKVYIEKAIQLSKDLLVDGHVQSHGSSETIFRIVWYGMKRVRNLLNVIRPCLCSKSRQADLVLKFIQKRLEKWETTHHYPYDQADKDLFMEVRRLNGKGRLPDSQFKLAVEESSETIRQIPKRVKT